MKKKMYLLPILVFFLIGCPSNDSIEFFNIKSINSKIIAENSGNIIKQNESISWNECALELSFSTIELLSKEYIQPISSVYATPYTNPELKTKIQFVTIATNSTYTEDSIEDLIIPYVSGLERNISINEAITWMSSLSHRNENLFPGGYLKFSKAPESDFTGKFYIELEFEDGTVLKDSTQTVTITKD